MYRLQICLFTLYTHLEGTVFQIFNLGLSFYFMTKIGKLLIYFANTISKLHKTKTRA